MAVEGEPRKLILASALSKTVSAKVGREVTVVATLPGERIDRSALPAAIPLLLRQRLAAKPDGRFDGRR